MALRLRTAVLLQCHCFLQSQLAINAPRSRLISTGSALDERDKILIKGIVIHGYHGALPEENVLGQKFVVDATLWTDLTKAGQSDQLQDTIDYSKVYQAVHQVVEGPARQLQEKVAEDLCQRILHLDQRVKAVQIYIRKPHVALKGVLESVGVEIFRTRLE